MSKLIEKKVAKQVKIKVVDFNADDLEFDEGAYNVLTAHLSLEWGSYECCVFVSYVYDDAFNSEHLYILDPVLYGDDEDIKLDEEQKKYIIKQLWKDKVLLGFLKDAYLYYSHN